MIEQTMGPSKANPGKTNVVIVGDSFDEVQGAIWDLEKIWPCVVFTIPVRAPNDRWGVMGRVWR